MNFRQKKASEFTPVTHEQVANLEYIPWTSTPGPKGLRTLLMVQFRAAMEHGFSLAEDGNTKSLIIQQLVNIIDIVLDGYQVQLERAKGARKSSVMKQYEKDRSEMIMAIGKAFFANFFALF